MIHVKSHRRGRSVVKAYSRQARLAGIFDRLNARQSNSGMRGVRILEGRKTKVLDALFVEANFNKRVRLAKRAGDRARKIQAHRRAVLGRRG
jgi:hypothetical protein